MAGEWQTIRSGPRDAPHGVLLLPGGANAAASYSDVMADPALAGVRLVAATLPGHAGAPPPSDYSVGAYAKGAATLATSERCDVVAGFSMGATVALEMAVSGLHAGPVVLMGISLSSADDPWFFRALNRLNPLLAGIPTRLFLTMVAFAARHTDLPEGRRRSLLQELRRNDPDVVGRSMSAYSTYVERNDAAERLCRADIPAWVVHAEKGDGGLTAVERRVLQECPQVRLITLPGTVWFFPDQRPHDIARIIAAAVSAAKAR